jgi:hypothetical protein
MVQEGSPFYPPGVIDLTNWDPWSARNQIYSTDPLNNPAPRTAGSVQAMQAVYKAGLVFRGNINLPIIDWRPYLENVLDMHNSHQSFASRQRMLDADGNASNQVIWFSAYNGGARPDKTAEALAVMDQWMQNIQGHPERGVVGNKPAGATDRCFDQAGNQLAAGANVWDGILNNNAPGACTQQFQLHSTSRRVAGGPFEQSIFKCQLIPVGEAITRGFYGTWTPSLQQQAWLTKIFPTGVCDYAKPDAGLPPGW